MKLVWWVLILAILIQVVPARPFAHVPGCREEPDWIRPDTASLFHRARYDCWQ